MEGGGRERSGRNGVERGVVGEEGRRKEEGRGKMEV